MVVRSPRALNIPTDAIASLEADGVLGPTFVEIDTRKASGPAAGDDAALQSMEVEKGQSARALEVLGNALLEESRKSRERDKSQTPQGTK